LRLNVIPAKCEERCGGDYISSAIIEREHSGVSG